TTTSVSSSLNPSAFGQSVTLTAQVTSSFTTVNTGSVTFKDGSTTLGGGAITVDATGKASIIIATLSVASHTITATYTDGTSFNTSNGSMTQTVTAAPTNTAATTSLTPTPFGQAVTCTG